MRVAAKLYLSVLAVILGPDEARNGALNGVSDGMHIEIVFIGLSVKVGERVVIALPERTRKSRSGSRLGCQPKAMLNSQKE